MLTSPDEEIRIGGSRLVHDGPDLAIVACGASVPEASQAAEILAAQDVHARVLYCYSIKPLDTDAVRAAAESCPLLITVEDHSPEGGLGDAVVDAIADGPRHPRVIKLAVRSLPGSGTPEELRRAAETDAAAIVRAAQEGWGATNAERAGRSCQLNSTDWAR